MKNAGLRHISLNTRNIKKTEEFYTRVLGLKIAFRIPPKHIFLRSGKADDMLHFMKTTKRVGPNQALDHFGFRVSQSHLKEIEKRVKNHGVEIEGRRGRNSIYFRDPNGYCVEFYCD